MLDAYLANPNLGVSQQILPPEFFRVWALSRRRISGPAGQDRKWKPTP